MRPCNDECTLDQKRKRSRRSGFGRSDLTASQKPAVELLCSLEVCFLDVARIAFFELLRDHGHLSSLKSVFVIGATRVHSLRERLREMHSVTQLVRVAHDMHRTNPSAIHLEAVCRGNVSVLNRVECRLAVQMRELVALAELTRDSEEEPRHAVAPDEPIPRRTRSAAPVT